MVLGLVSHKLTSKCQKNCGLFLKSFALCLLINKVLPEDAVSNFSLDYLEKTGSKRGKGKKLVGALSAQKMLIYAPLLKWYLEHGLEITKVHLTIKYKPEVVFDWLVEKVTEERRKGDVDKNKALFADMFKLLGNSAYGKFIENLEDQTNITYTKNEKVVDRTLRSVFFSDTNEIGEAYELKSRKQRVTIDRPFHASIEVYQLAKLRMLEFYYDFLDRYIDRRDFELIQMDTNSFYMAISDDSLDEIVKPDMVQEFDREKHEWVAVSDWDKRTPGLFKLEAEGSAMIALCPKCYYLEPFENGKTKCSSKGIRTSITI